MNAVPKTTAKANTIRPFVDNIVGPDVLFFQQFEIVKANASPTQSVLPEDIHCVVFDVWVISQCPAYPSLLRYSTDVNWRNDFNFDMSKGRPLFPFRQHIHFKQKMSLPLRIWAVLSVVWGVTIPSIDCFSHHVCGVVPPRRSRLAQLGLSVDESSVDLADVDVLLGSRSSLQYDSALERYVPVARHNQEVYKLQTIRVNGDATGSLARRKSVLVQITSKLVPRLKAAFFPEGVTESYYRFVGWRVLQRFVNANLHVIGTQSLLLGLGLKNKALGLSAALNWVLKDALGKIVRLLWASKMGRKFDSDAKRWRFRSSLLYAMGSGLEIVTYIFPAFFLLWATLANCFKQVSFLTSSSTRTAIYNSFRTKENIGDITAKGEAQLAIVDLMGILSGIVLCRRVGMSIQNVVAAYFVLQVLEIGSMYKTIQAVEFRVLNFERLIQVVRKFVESGKEQPTAPQVIPTPTSMASTEKIFLPPQHLDRRAIAFGSLGRAKLKPQELSKLLEIFRDERYLLVVGQDVKNQRRADKRLLFRKSPTASKEEGCHIVLHVDANDLDIVKSSLALTYLRSALRSKEGEPLRCQDCWEEIELANRLANEKLPSLLKQLSRQGWASPGRFMFGRTTRRADWPLTNGRQ